LKREIINNDEWLSFPNNKKLLFHTKRIPFDYDNASSIGILGVSRDITKVHVEQEKIKALSCIDELTKAYNRKSYNESIQYKIDIFKRYNTKFCIAMYDIDDFKSVNDTYGHDVGDKVLVEMTKNVQDNIRVTDKLFRVGGEEFILIFSSSELGNTHLVIDKIRVMISELKLIENKEVTVSIGLTEVSAEDTIDSIYKRVDQLLYQSKNTGKNKVSI